MSVRKVTELLHAQPASDGDGVKLLRVFGGRGPERFDPFLMLDEFGSYEASDYIGGFPPHPHRGFETVTYMLEGKMEHQDHMGNIGLLNDGDVQWMTAAGGVIHSEMPKQTEGRMRGFQLWVNLPADKKMAPAQYADVPSREIPVFEREGLRIKAIAGEALVNHEPVKGRFTDVATQPTYLDVHISAGQSLTLPVGLTHTALVYVYEGQVCIGDAETPVHHQQLARLTDGNQVSLLNNAQSEARALILVAEPLREPIVQYGPFVMNSMAEIERAMADYRNGTFVSA
ncbi:MAG TPA: pirin family protein [Marinagarivorans sp.]